MPLTSSQEQYLKGLNIGKGAGTAGALSGAGKGAAIGTTIMPGVGTVVGGILGGIGGLFGGKSKAKKEQAAARAALEKAAGEFNQKEDTRLAKLNAGQGLLRGLQGSGFANIDPETLAKLETRRELDPATVGLSNPEAGAVSGAIGGLVNDAMDIGSQYGINKMSAPKASTAADVFHTGPEVAPEGLDSSFQDTLGTGGGAFGAGGVGPQGVSLDDLKNLYKLGGSGTANFG